MQIGRKNTWDVRDSDGGIACRPNWDICVVSSKEAKASGAPFAAIFAAHFAN